jgi:hypothetical protein
MRDSIAFLPRNIARGSETPIIYNDTVVRGLKGGEEKRGSGGTEETAPTGSGHQ